MFTLILRPDPPYFEKTTVRMTFGKAYLMPAPVSVLVRVQQETRTDVHAWVTMNPIMHVMLHRPKVAFAI